MGLCFVSEGAIPYAAADPLRVLPSCVVGSALAGALSMTFGCALRAPHGGIFVFPVVDHAVLYCVALAVGSVLGAVILSLVKRPSLLRQSNKPFSFSIRIVLATMKIGFDNDKYLAMQSEHIRERIKKFGDKLYLEFGGKLFDDYHASRVLPGFAAGL